METRRLLFTLGGLTLVRLAFGQAPPPPGNSLIPYRKLTWRDFPIRDDQGHRTQLARTEGRIVWKYRTQWAEKRRGSFAAELTEITLDTFFDTKRSWRKTNLGTDPDRLLAHEQIHLDLTYLHMLRLRMVPLEQFGVGTGESAALAQTDLDEKIKNYFEVSIKEHQQVQDRFDRETTHGMDQLAQLSWERKLARAIQEYSPPTR